MREIDQGDARLLGEGMQCGGGRNQPVAIQGKIVQRVVAGRIASDRGVQMPVAQPLDDFGRVADADADAGVGIVFDVFRDQARRVRGRVGTQADGGVLAFHVGVHERFDFVRKRKERPGEFEQSATCRGQLERLLASIEKGDPMSGLQRADLLRQRRLRDPQTAGAATEAALLRNSVEGAQVLMVHTHDPSLNRNSATKPGPTVNCGSCAKL